MTDDQIREIAFANGFKAKWSRPGYGPDLHGYVFDFARAIIAAQLAAPAAEPAGWRDFLVQLSHADGCMVNGNRLSQTAKDLLAAPHPSEVEAGQRGLASLRAAMGERQPVAWAVYFKRKGDAAEDKLLVYAREQAEKEVHFSLITRIVPLYRA